jgi:hypothetical protein
VPQRNGKADERGIDDRNRHFDLPDEPALAGLYEDW